MGKRQGKDWSPRRFRLSSDYSLARALAGPAAVTIALPKPGQGAILPPTGEQCQEVGQHRVWGERRTGARGGGHNPNSGIRRQVHSYAKHTRTPQRPTGSDKQLVQGA